MGLYASNHAQLPATCQVGTAGQGRGQEPTSVVKAALARLFVHTHPLALATTYEMRNGSVQ